jgi:hypothetical protein
MSVGEKRRDEKKKKRLFPEQKKKRDASCRRIRRHGQIFPSRKAPTRQPADADLEKRRC